MEENSMNLKRVLFSAALLAIVASSAYAQLGFNVATLDLGPVALPTSTLDATNTSGIIQASPNPAGVDSYVAYAYDGGNWDLTGLNSSVCAAHSDKYSLASMSVTDYRSTTSNDTFFGTDVVPYDGPGSVVLFTYAGDTDLDGQITGYDYGAINASIYSKNHGGSPAGTWVNGDLDHDGVITGYDYGALNALIYAKNHGTLLPNLYPSGIAGAGGIAPVPEPSTLLLGFLAVTCFLGFRKLWN
jgi:hypothetical protein